jgi:magnesium chelatase family protein
MEKVPPREQSSYVSLLLWTARRRTPSNTISHPLSRKRISGPLLDRIDIHVEVARVQYEKLASERQGEPSSTVRERVSAAPERAISGTRLLTNSDMDPAEVRRFCALDGAGQRLMPAAMRQPQLSARGYHRVLKLARTIADLPGAPEIGPAHLAEALQYRSRRVE